MGFENLGSFHAEKKVGVMVCAVLDTTTIMFSLHSFPPLIYKSSILITLPVAAQDTANYIMYPRVIPIPAHPQRPAAAPPSPGRNTITNPHPSRQIPRALSPNRERVRDGRKQQQKDY